MYFESFGEGRKKTVFLIHGAMWSRSLHRQMPLSKYFNTVFVHMDGHGKEFDNRFERENVANGITDYMKEHKIIKPHLLGFSLGTQICLMLANKESEKFDKIALVSPLIDATERDISSIKFTMKAMAAIVKLRPFAAIASSVLKLEEDKKKEFVEEMKSQNVSVLAEDIMKERLNSEDLPNLNNVKNSFYIATGLKDAECFINSAKKLKNIIPDCTLSAFESCGHNIPIICHERLNEELKIFYKSNV